MNILIPDTIRGINALPTQDKHQIYSELLPEWIFDEYAIQRDNYKYKGHRVIDFHCPADSRSVEIIVKDRASDADPLFYLHMADNLNNQLLILLVNINDPTAPRFNIDIDRYGNTTHMGTQGRNTPAELAAMAAGLAPGQVRRGLRAARDFLPVFEAFIQKMRHDIFFVEPMSYHNAINFENYGFNYSRGLKDMRMIHEQFQPGNELYCKLTPDNPFRQPQSWRTVRSRSWAIHDGILGYPYTGFQMYKRVGHHAHISTFPDAIW